MFDKRVKKLRQILEDKRLDGLLVSNFYNILYLTGFKTLAPQDREAFFLVTKKKSYLFTDARYLTQATDEFELRLFEPKKRLSHYLQEIVVAESIRRLGFESEDLKFHEYESLSKKLKRIVLVSTQNVVLKLRALKDAEEIAKIKVACQISSQYLQEIIKTVKIGQTEKEIAFKLEAWLKQKGYDLAFDPIVAAGANAAVPHYNTKTGSGKIKSGEVLLVDFGAKYKDYCSDMARVFFVGRAKSEMINAYNKLLTVQEKTIQRAKVGQQLKQLDSYCRKLLKANKLPNFSHSTGHGVGLEVHESPRVSPLSKDTISDNQVFTIEPGVYIEGSFGMRIEDTVVVQNKSLKILTQLSKQPAFLPL